MLNKNTMKKNYMLRLALFIFMHFILDIKAQTANRFEGLQNQYNNSEIVFEGHFLKANPSFMTDKKEILTLMDFKVTKLFKGSIGPDSIVKIEVEGGSVYDPNSGMTLEGRSAHGNGLLNTSKGVYFLRTKNTRGNNRLNNMVDIANPEKLQFNDVDAWNTQPYVKLAEFYSDLSTLVGWNIPLEKKSPNANGEIRSELKDIPYTEKYKNFQNIISTKIKVAASNPQNKTSLVNDLTLLVTNPVVTGSFFEFDVNIRADNNTTYLDNVPVWLTYNSAVFGASVVAANNVTVTNGPNFSNPSDYMPANANMIDNASNVFAFVISANFVGNPVRTQITTSYQFLAHVRMGVIDCGNVSTSLTNSATAINACFYTSTPTGTTFNSYNTLTYNGSLTNNITFCPPTIKDFSSPINGGMNQTLTIKGTKFGAVRGNGQVKFRNSDNFGFPWMNKLDNLDYISWNDTMIQVRMPSTIDTLNFGGGSAPWTPGSGSFKVKTNSGDSAISGLNLAASTFSVYYSIYNQRPISVGISQNQKLKANLIKSNAVTGGYIIRLDTSVGNDPLKVMCIKKAIKDWACLTEVNIKLGADTVMQAYGVADYMCNFIMADAAAMSSTNTIAETSPRTANCPSTPPVKVITDFDIRINKAYLPKFFYDTTLATLPALKIDFLEVMYHEIAHGVGLMHITDSAGVMYYRTLGNLAVSIPGGQRRRPIPFTTDVDGMDNQVSSSAVIMTNQCGLQDMVQLNAGSCAIIGIEEFLNNKFNAVVYPNPSQDGKIYLTFDVPDATRPIVEIYDVVGKKVYSETLPLSFNKHYTHQLNVSDFSNGVYILNIQSNLNKASFKLIKN